MRCHSDAFGRVGRRGGGAAAAGGSAGGARPGVHGVGPRMVGPRGIGGGGHELSRTVNEETTLPISCWRCW